MGDAALFYRGDNTVDERGQRIATLERENAALQAQLHANQHADTEDLARMMADRDTERARADALEGKVKRLREYALKLRALVYLTAGRTRERDVTPVLSLAKHGLHPNDLDDAPAAEGDRE